MVSGEEINVEELTLRVSGNFPHNPGPITQSAYKTYKQSVLSADLLDFSGFNCVSGPTIKVSGKNVIMTASFQAQWDAAYSASARILVTLGP
jgi:hypothetical protein